MGNQPLNPLCRPAPTANTREVPRGHWGLLWEFPIPGRRPLVVGINERICTGAFLRDGPRPVYNYFRGDATGLWVGWIGGLPIPADDSDDSAARAALHCRGPNIGWSPRQRDSFRLCSFGVSLGAAERPDHAERIIRLDHVDAAMHGLLVGVGVLVSESIREHAYAEPVALRHEFRR